MKVVSVLIPVLLCLVLIVVPIFELVALINDVSFTLYNELAVVITQTALSLVAMVALLIIRPEYNWFGKLVCLLITPLALINGMCFVDGWKFSILFAAAWSVCAFVIYMRFVPDSNIKATMAVVTVLVAVALVILYIIFGVFAPITVTKSITQTVSSPNGEYNAHIMSVDGLFSEKTHVEVEKVTTVKAVLGYYSESNLVAYTGEFHEYHTIGDKIHWKNDNTLVIKDEEFVVDFN